MVSKQVKVGMEEAVVKVVGMEDEGVMAAVGTVDMVVDGEAVMVVDGMVVVVVGMGTTQISFTST
ncbi:MAG TPA: hypothetical protein VI935_01005 [Thermodesulfobacteriota bacterium]|nr:hypothetical protein [Thermodesulfobacteriota bacterium]